MRELHAFRRGELPDGVVVARELPAHREGGILDELADRFRVECSFDGGRDRAQAGVAAQSEAVDEALVGFGKIVERVGFEYVRDVGGRDRQEEHFLGSAALGIQTKRSERDAAGSALRRHHAATGTNEVGSKLSHTDLLSVDLRKSGSIARGSKGKRTFDGVIVEGRPLRADARREEGMRQFSTQVGVQQQGREKVNALRGASQW